MAQTTPTVWISRSGGTARTTLEQRGTAAGAIRLDSAAWFEWLEAEATRSFAYPIDAPQGGYIQGFMTVRKERRQRGGTYWVAYRRVGGRLRKAYMGSSRRVTTESLAAIACTLQGREVMQTEQPRQ